MTRNLSNSKTFFSHRDTDNRGENRELYLTPKHIIKQVVRNLIKHYPQLKDKVWIDPCAGDGRWAKIIRSYGIKCESYDLCPLNDSVKQKDFLEFNSFPYDKNHFFCGNPPFSLLKEFVYQGLKSANCCYFLGGSQVITGTLGKYVKLLHRFNEEGKQKDKRSKVWFIDSNKKKVLVWCCGGLFTRKTRDGFKHSDEKVEHSFRTGVGSFCLIDKRVKSLKNYYDKNKEKQ